MTSPTSAAEAAPDTGGGDRRPPPRPARDPHGDLRTGMHWAAVILTLSLVVVVAILWTAERPFTGPATQPQPTRTGSVGAGATSRLAADPPLTDVNQDQGNPVPLPDGSTLWVFADTSHTRQKPYFFRTSSAAVTAPGSTRMTFLHGKDGTPIEFLPRSAEEHAQQTVDAYVPIWPSGALALPDGRIVAAAPKLDFAPGQSTILTGASGSGKSTLFRAVAGIWPFGRGRVETPKGQSVMLLPQRPYVPLGTLRGAIAYPGAPDAYGQAEIEDAMRAVGLDHLIARLEDEAIWTQALSGGEQQRVAIVRALLAKPDWLFLDEATAALDEPMEVRVYEVLRSRLPKTTLVSIGHRKTLLPLHERHVDMRRGADGAFRPEDVAAAAAAS